MATRIIVPHLGESIETALLASWRKHPGDSVQRGEEIAEIETDKALMPLEAPVDGVLLARLVEAGTEVHIGQLLAMVGRPGESWSTEADASSMTVVDRMPAASQRPPPMDNSTHLADRRHRVSPLARRRAKELGVDLQVVVPGRGDKISVEDVERYAAQRRTSDNLPASHRVPIGNLKKIVGKRMLESAQTIPQFSVSMQVNAAGMLDFREALTEQHKKVSLTAFLVYFTARALMQHPFVNAQFDGDTAIVYDTCNIGIAVASAEGLRVPVLCDAQTLSLTAIADRIRDLADRARQNQLTNADVAGCTFTISNLGMYGVSQFVPMVNPPQAAILGVGEPQPVYMPGASGRIDLAQLLTLTISADHRILDGVDVASFMSTLKMLIERCEIDAID